MRDFKAKENLSVPRGWLGKGRGMAGLLFAQGSACSSPKFAQPQAVKRLLFNPERAEAQSPAHLQGGIGPAGWGDGQGRLP